MQKITTLFWDVGGVILSNGWDFPLRKRASQKFDFDLNVFEIKHAQFSEVFETGRIDTDEYLKQTLFFQTRLFDKQEFKAFMFSLSEPHKDIIDIVERIAVSKKYLMATINNESLELNNFRIEKFHLRNYFTNFFSSCFLRMRKPDSVIYEKALQISQRKPEECLFIDDRKENLEQARALGISTIHYEGVNQLQHELRLRLGE